MNISFEYFKHSDMAFADYCFSLGFLWQAILRIWLLGVVIPE